MSSKAAVPSDLEVAQAATVRPIADIAESTGIEPGNLIQYGRHNAHVGRTSCRS